MSYRPRPVRRVEIPKEDGKMRLLGISCTEDKIVQELTRRILEAVYEPVFIDTSYGLRPGRSCHDALRRLNHEVMREPVNWIADLDLAQFFDHVRHDVLLAKVAKRIDNPDVMRVLKRILKTTGKKGVAQGDVFAPLLSNLYGRSNRRPYAFHTEVRYFRHTTMMAGRWFLKSSSGTWR